jgi:hypothetical protein
VAEGLTFAEELEVLFLPMVETLAPLLLEGQDFAEEMIQLVSVQP